MATAPMPQVLVLKDALLTIGTTDWQKSVSNVTFTPSSSALTWQGLSPDASYSSSTSATWVCSMEIAQDWTTVDSLCRYLFDHEGDTVAAVFEPKAGEGASFTANLIITPGAIGGAVNAVALQTVSLGCVGRPVLVPATP